MLVGAGRVSSPPWDRQEEGRGLDVCGEQPGTGSALVCLSSMWLGQWQMPFL